VVAFLQSWDPLIGVQLTALDELAAVGDQAVVAVLVQESDQKVAVLKQIGRYQLAMVADPVGAMAEQLQVTVVPSYLRFNRSGVVEAVTTGRQLVLPGGD
jgi:hypothetical protein